MPTTVFESPHRVAATLCEISDLLPDVELVIGRELTKLHEQIWRGRPAQAVEAFAEPRGEFTILIIPAEPEASVWSDAAVRDALSDAAEAGASRARRRAQRRRAGRAATPRGSTPCGRVDRLPPACDAENALGAFGVFGDRYGKLPTVTENILVCVAWPYANGPIHHGQLGGAYLPADIFARYHRIRGNRVAMVSGSDTHGTPITVRADEEGRRPEDVVAEFHESILETWEGIGISFDTFTTTMTDTPPRRDPRPLPPPAGERPPLHRHTGAVLRRRGEALPARPVHRRHLPTLRRHGARAATSATPADGSWTPRT